MQKEKNNFSSVKIEIKTYQNFLDFPILKGEHGMLSDCRGLFKQRPSNSAESSGSLALGWQSAAHRLGQLTGAAWDNTSAISERKAHRILTEETCSRP